MGIIYVITNRVNGKRYVGQTVRTLNKRWNSHKCSARKSDRDTPINLAIRKYGVECFTIEAIASCENFRLNELETHYIKLFNTHADKGHGYNRTFGGIGTRGLECSESTKEKLRKANVGKVMSPESIEKTRLANIGKVVSFETRKKIGDARRGYKHTPEAVAKIVARHKGSKRSEETKAKMREIFSSPERRERQSQLATAYWEKRRQRVI